MTVRRGLASVCHINTERYHSNTKYHPSINGRQTLPKKRSLRLFFRHPSRLLNDLVFVSPKLVECNSLPPSASFPAGHPPSLQRPALSMKKKDPQKVTELELHPFIRLFLSPFKMGNLPWVSLSW